MIFFYVSYCFFSIFVYIYLMSLHENEFSTKNHIIRSKIGWLPFPFQF